METHLHQKGRDSVADVSGKMERMEYGETGGQKKRKVEEEPALPPWVPSAAMAAGPVSGGQCVSMVIRVEHKEGVSWRNAGLNEAEVGLVLCFSAKAAVMGPVVAWRQDPQNRPMSEEETTTESKVRKRLMSQKYRCMSPSSPVFLPAGAPGVLRKDRSLVPCNPAWIFLPTGGTKLSGKNLLI